MPPDIFDELISDYRSKEKPISKNLIIAILQKHADENLRINGLKIYRLIEKFNPRFTIPELENILKICEMGVAQSITFGEWELLKDFLTQLYNHLKEKIEKEFAELPAILPMSENFERLREASQLQIVTGTQLIKALIDSSQNDQPVPYDMFYTFIKDAKDILTIDECQKMLKITIEASVKLKQFPDYIKISNLLEKFIKQLKQHGDDILWKT